MITQLSKAYTLLDRDPELRCGVLWAEGRYFTSGLDLANIIKAIPSEVIKPMIPRRHIDPWGTNGRVCRKPIVSAVEGPCYTLGIELILCGQITVASENAIFTQAEISRGIFPFGGGTVRWPLAAGTQNAYLHLLTADEFDAGEALTEAIAIAIAEQIAQQAPLGVQATLKSVRLCNPAVHRPHSPSYEEPSPDCCYRKMPDAVWKPSRHAERQSFRGSDGRHTRESGYLLLKRLPLSRE
ncbi:enoyl-CoA hydratase/isomerase family protein [Oleiphilus messinensis]|uniref:Enoyl-CoA hydratase/isomerase family protein n=2 Tax=Oleiphilus messinensis TaxID=141451 RepID=A0A1Y0I267_9GAMM|nr:enoyl-CoA hydratase/isomerase family protein [Oleiphilus messinensis]